MAVITKGCNAFRSVLAVFACNYFVIFLKVNSFFYHVLTISELISLHDIVLTVIVYRDKFKQKPLEKRASTIN